MNIQLLMTGTFAVSLFTGLTVEAIKKLINKETRCYNLLAVIVSCVLSIALGVGYVVLQKIPFDAEVIITIIVMCFMSFLASTLGYDKIKQTVEQILAGK